MDISHIRHVAIVGAGTMGSGIAQVFAQHSYSVTLVDAAETALAKAKVNIQQSLDKLVKKGTVKPADRDATLSRIACRPDLDAVGGADYVVEAIIEDLDAKRALLSRLDVTVQPHVILSSNTSSISISALAAATKRPQMVLGMHFMNPPAIMPLVELIRGMETTSDTMNVAASICSSLGKTTAEAADFPGFIGNRILLPMINEAIYALMEGVGNVDAIDTVMKLGMNHPMGPLKLADLIGLDVCLSILTVLHEGFGDPKYRPCPLLRRMVSVGHLGRKSGRGFYSYETS